MRVNLSNQLQFEQEKLLAKNKQESADAEIRYNKAIASSLESKIKGLSGLVGAFKEGEKGTKEYNDANAALLDTQLAYTKVLTDIKAIEEGLAKDRASTEPKRIKQEPIDNVEKFQAEIKPLVRTDIFVESIQKQIDSIEKVPEIPLEITVNTEEVKENLNEISEEGKKLIDEISTYIQYAQQIGAQVQSLSNEVFANQTAELQARAQGQLDALSVAEETALRSAGDNTERRRRIEEKFAEKRTKIEKQVAYEKAVIERKQAKAAKAFAIFNLVLSTAQAVLQAFSQLGPIGGAIAGAIIAALGIAQIAVVAARPLPELPKFEKGVLKVKRGKNKPGIDTIPALLTEGESVITAKASNKYSDELKAAQDLQLEDLIFRYIVLHMCLIHHSQSRLIR